MGKMFHYFLKFKKYISEIQKLLFNLKKTFRVKHLTFIPFS